MRPKNLQAILGLSAASLGVGFYSIAAGLTLAGLLIFADALVDDWRPR